MALIVHLHTESAFDGIYALNVGSLGLNHDAVPPSYPTPTSRTYLLGSNDRPITIFTRPAAPTRPAAQPRAGLSVKFTTCTPDASSAHMPDIVTSDPWHPFLPESNLLILVTALRPAVQLYTAVAAEEENLVVVGEGTWAGQ